MHYDQSWMGFGLVGALQAGAISAAAAFLLYALFHWIGNRNDWKHGMRAAWAFLTALFLTGSGDLWDMVYFNYGRVESIQFLKVKLAEVHDFDGLGTRVFFEFLGVTVGVCSAWLLLEHRRRSAARGKE
jgi:multisubunit Na+/H+ antiporter MnhB subunit